MPNSEPIKQTDVPSPSWYGFGLKLFIGALMLVGLAIWWMAPADIVVPQIVEADIKTRPVQVPSDGYVGSAKCQSCHADQHASWDESFHQSMTQLPTAETVLGNFDQELELDGIRYGLEHDDQGYWVSANLGNGPVRLKIQLLTGSHHMQLYWFGMPENIPPLGPKKILGLLPFVYLISEQEWLPRRATFLTPPGKSETFEVGRWNSSCLRCHSTHPKANYYDTNNPDTTVVEFGISCEACHGPAGAHIESHTMLATTGQDTSKLEEQAKIGVVNPAKLDHVRSSQICANCHAATSILDPDKTADWHAHGNSFRPSNDLLQHRHLIRAVQPDAPMTKLLSQADPQLFDSTFWSDGMVRVTGREYSGLVESKCFSNGALSCLSCHTLHNIDVTDVPHADTVDSAWNADTAWNDDMLKPGMRGNQACRTCHQEYQGDALQSHTHHLAESSGSQCYNCHMPHTSYGLLKAVRSHQISVPSAAETLSVGRQNACNICHIDKPLAWTAKNMQLWYGHEVPELSEVHEKISSTVLMLLTGDAGQRALAAWEMSWDPAVAVAGGDWQGEILEYLLEDPYDAIGVIAIRSLKKLHPALELNVRNPAAQRTGVARYFEDLSQPACTDGGVLRKADGQLDRFVLEFLFKQRNNRTMFLQE